MSAKNGVAVWFPAIRTGTGTDVFTERLVEGLTARGIRSEITWLPLRVEYAPWTAWTPSPPIWASIVHVNTWLPSGYLPERLPVIATIHHAIHDPKVQSYKGRARRMYHRWWIAPNERRVLRRANSVVAVSRFAADMAKQHLLDVPAKVIYNGVDMERFHPGGRQRVSGGVFRLLYIGNWKELKGVDMLAPTMVELGDEFELYFTGDLSVERTGLPENMHDIGRLTGDDVAVAMKEADALLFPSRSEGLGLVAIEAMACGLPVIAARRASLPEIVQDGVTGFLCLQDSVASFAAAIRTLKHNIGLHEAMREKARSSVEQKFSIDEMVSSYLEEYERCLRTL